MAQRKRVPQMHLPVDPLWYKDAIIYEVHVRAFYDSDGDGIGDFRGLTEKLGYLADLGVTAIWLLPFYPSPLKDDGYDIAEYTDVHPSYGTLADVRRFIREAHDRGIRIITELVCNHTSDRHPWFQRARTAKPGSAYRDFYVWSDSTEKYQDARIIFQDYEASNWSWDPIAKAYYWHRFFSHQPDLNFDNPAVQKAILNAMDFWLDLGVDGLRLDAIPYLFEREGTICENLPETHAFLRVIRERVEERYRDRMLLGEANQWPEDAVAYFGKGDECHMAFHFPLMPRLFMSIWAETRFPIIDILKQTPQIPASAQWGIFLRNHDELTLEMVSEEERDYMYKMFAHDPQARINLGIRRRLAPLLRGNRRRLELLNGLLFSLPGTPFIYYGDEIGMGDNIYLGDRSGVRTPMQWSPDRNAGFSRCNPQQLFLPVIVDPEYHYESVNVFSQENNPQSFLWWMKRLISLRKTHRVFGRGTLDFLFPDNRRVLAFTRTYEQETVLVVANLSRFVQGVDLPLTAYKGRQPVEMFGRIEFPPIRDVPYFLTLGPHAFYWFLLESPVVSEARCSPELQTTIPEISLHRTFEEIFQGHRRADLQGLLTPYLQRQPWISRERCQISSLQVEDAVPIEKAPDLAMLLLLQVDFNNGEAGQYLLALGILTGEPAQRVLERAPRIVLGKILAGKQLGLLCDLHDDASFHVRLVDLIAQRKRRRGRQGEILGMPAKALESERNGPNGKRGQQPETTGAHTDKIGLRLKIFRQIDEGPNPELEMSQYLSGDNRYAHTPPFSGAIEYRRSRHQAMTLAVLHELPPHQGNAFELALDSLHLYLEKALTGPQPTPATAPREAAWKLASSSIPPEASERVGSFLEPIGRIGQRLGELHLALAAAREDGFTPEPFTVYYQRSIYQSMRSQACEIFQALRQDPDALPAPIRQQAGVLVGREEQVLKKFASLLEHKISARRIRCHGDFHLAHVLVRGQDFVISAFEGEQSRSIAERRIKRSPLRDVAAMLLSLHYASATALSNQIPDGGIHREQDIQRLQPWAAYWTTWVSAAFLREYFQITRSTGLFPTSEDELATLLEVYMLDRALFELARDLRMGSRWLAIPITAILELLQLSEGSSD